ncbi:hypothetical protein QQS21_006657 [Conoideocrella luteorostrata]|uniref:NADPH--cytochrome P450 reductase n=1 Tax=Conoideocrella luteorostrata TaxID=1105319 RepID=A0AAJ0CM47_9HYPO|nr:hypothetical protein QQS21_006657 [Conoideocrella luteorostrata]
MSFIQSYTHHTTVKYIRELASLPTELSFLAVLDSFALLLAGVALLSYLFPENTWDRPDPYRHIWFEKPQVGDNAISNNNQATRDISQMLDKLNKNAVIFWGSQSGTSERLANLLARELSHRFGLETLAADLSDFDPESIMLIPKSKIALFLLSTYGEGDPSDNANSFWAWLDKDNLPSLSGLRYSAFGLGNSNYKHYNRVVDVVDMNLRLAGAEQLLPAGKADDAAGTTEEDFLRWKSELFAFLVNGLNMKESDSQYKPVLSTVYDSSLEQIDLHHGQPDDSGVTGSNESPAKSLLVTNARELFTAAERNCLHLDISLSGQPEMSYKTGDHLGVWPMNPDQEVERLIQAMGVNHLRHVPLSISANDAAISIQFPSPTTITALFRYYVEICAPISRDTLRTISEFAPSPEAKAWLLHLGSDKNIYRDFLDKTHLNIGRLLELAAGKAIWTELPLSFLLENLPRTRPRYYSISSSNVLSPRIISLTILVPSTKLKNNENTVVPGLATGYLLAHSNSRHDVQIAPSHPSNLSYELSGPSGALEGGKIFAQIRHSTFKLPRQPTCPLIMIAAGTGIAPFRAFIAERSRIQTSGVEVGQMILFFGCRHPEYDYIYRDELEALITSLGGKLDIKLAFSRSNRPEKTYVQDKILESKENICRLLGEGASLYVCGRASMAREVGNHVLSVIVEDKGWEEAEGQKWITTMKQTRKWQEDVWG